MYHKHTQSRSQKEIKNIKKRSAMPFWTFKTGIFKIIFIIERNIYFCTVVLFPNRQKFGK